MERIHTDEEPQTIRRPPPVAARTRREGIRENARGENSPDSIKKVFFGIALWASLLAVAAGPATGASSGIGARTSAADDGDVGGAIRGEKPSSGSDLVEIHAPSRKLKAKKSADRIVPRSNATIDGRDSESICFGTDDRVRSFDARVGRFSPVGCTAWLIAEDVFVTAGHCVDFAPSALPDGYFVEFNVPLSDPDGVSVRSAPEDVYAVRYDIGGTFPVEDLEWFFGEDLGNDWNVGRLLPNEVTGAKPGKAQGCWLNLEFRTLPNESLIRITGHGVTDPREELNVVQQTHLGRLEYTDLNNFILRYVTDTTGGNSGGPVIDEETGGSIGVHTNGGCSLFGGANHGMSNKQPLFRQAVELYLGVAPEDQVRSPVCPTEFPDQPPLLATPSPIPSHSPSLPFPARSSTSTATHAPSFYPTPSFSPTHLPSYDSTHFTSSAAVESPSSSPSRLMRVANQPKRTKANKIDKTPKKKRGKSLSTKRGKAENLGGSVGIISTTSATPRTSTADATSTVSVSTGSMSTTVYVKRTRDHASDAAYELPPSVSDQHRV